MRNFILTTITTLLSIAAIGQVDTAQVYNFVDQMPLIPTCGTLDTSYVAKQKCTQDLLLDFIYRNVQYPCLLYTSPSPRDATLSRMPSSA